MSLLETKVIKAGVVVSHFGLRNFLVLWVTRVGKRYMQLKYLSPLFFSILEEK